jgi:hypothetical protein
MTDRPALDDDVTWEMIRAGAERLALLGIQGEDPISNEYVATQVYRAMERARRGCDDAGREG